MNHNAKILLLKAATALVVIGTVCLVVLFRSVVGGRSAPASELQIEPRAEVVAPAPAPRLQDPDPAPAAEPLAEADPQTDPEDAVQREVEEALDRDPNQALLLLSQADAQFPAGRLADERQFLRLKAMVNLNQIPEARVAATNYLELNPRSPIGRKIYRLLGIHAPPELPSR
jgi:hypothetical protein